MGFLKKLFNDVGDAIKNNVEERKQEIRQNIEERKQQFYESIEERKKEALSKLGVKSEETDQKSASIYDVVTTSDDNNRKRDGGIAKETAKNKQEQEHEETMKEDNNPEVGNECKSEILSNPSAEEGGIFSARLESIIAAALQDGVLTDKEREILKRRVEKEGEDWEEVEMIIEARLAEMRPTSQPKNGVGRNAVCEKDTVGTPSIPPIETKQVVNVPILDDSIFDRSKAERYSNERNVDIPEGYIELGEECFEESDLQSICLPSTLEKINDNAFVLCNKMKKVDFSKCTSLIEIGDYVFRGCTKLEEIVLPDSVTTIGDGAFYYCTKLRKIVMPSSLEKLGDSVFQDCDSLEEVDMSKVTKLTTIPEGFKTGDDKQMVIPMGVTTIRKDAFEYCNMYALFLPPTLKDYMDTHGNWESVYLFASPLEKMDNIFENSNNLYVLPQYLEVYKSIHEALGEYSWCEIHTMPDEFMFFYDN